MRGRIIILFLFFFPYPAISFAQEWQDIKNDDRYIWGEGWGRSVEEADKEALAVLASKISVSVSGEFRQWEEQTDGNGGSNWYSSRSNRVSMSSNASLYNTRRIVFKTGRKSHVGRWIDRNELEATFRDRRARVLEYETSAMAAEGDLRLDEALRCHYRAYVLLRSLQRPSELRDDGGMMLLNVIPERLNAILDGITVKARKQENNLFLVFWYRNRRVRGLEFRFFDGAKWSAPCSAIGGSAMVELAPGATCSVIQLRIEYMFQGDALLDAELSEFLSSADIKPLKKAMKIFRAK